MRALVSSSIERVVANAFVAGIAGVDFLFILLRHRDNENGLAEIACFADQLLSCRA